MKASKIKGLRGYTKVTFIIKCVISVTHGGYMEYLPSKEEMKQIMNECYVMYLTFEEWNPVDHMDEINEYSKRIEDKYHRCKFALMQVDAFNRLLIDVENQRREKSG